MQTGQMYIYSISGTGKLVGESSLSQFDYASLLIANKRLQMVGVTPDGYFLLVSETGDTEVFGSGLSHTFIEIYTRYEFIVDIDNYSVTAGAVTTDDRSYTYTMPNDIGEVPNLGAWTYITDPNAVPEHFVHTPTISGISRATGVRRISDYEYTIENALSFIVNGGNMQLVTSAIGVPVKQVRGARATNSPEGTVGALCTLYNEYDGIIGQIIGEFIGYYTQWNGVYDLTSLADLPADIINDYINEQTEAVTKYSVDIYTFDRNVITPSAILSTEGRSVFAETFFDKVGVRRLPHQTYKLKWVYNIDWDLTTFP